MEESQVKELRRRMKGSMSQELYEDELIFIRFLRARSHNIDAAETMLKTFDKIHETSDSQEVEHKERIAHIKWRIEHKVDSILTEFTPNKFMRSEYFPLSRIGNDLEDSPISFLHFGNFDFRGMIKSSVKCIDVQLFVAYYLETKVAEMEEHNEKTGKLIDKWVWIFDFENFSLASATYKPTLEIFSALVSLYEANYPERLKVAYIVNTSYYFSLFWAVLKPFLSPPTAKKVKIFGKTGWQEELLQNISPDVLPAFLGGNRTDPDGNPLCKSAIKHGGPVPETFFDYANKTCAARLPGAKKLSVSRMAKSEVKLRVPQSGSTIEWEFVLKNRDIGFSVHCREDAGGDARAREVIPEQRIETSEAPESGMYKCETAGTYILEFDNTYSWLHSKEIYYTTSVVNPHKQDFIE